MSREILNYRVALDWMSKLIDRMKMHGWTERCVMGDIYVYEHPDLPGMKFDSWLEAIQTCIEVATPCEG